MTERIVLFGAGASFGAGHVLPKAPPLGKDLYAELVRCFPQSWGNLPTEVRELFKTDFEQGMQVLWDKYSQNIALLMRHMTLYLAQFRPDGSRKDLYSSFLGALGNRLASSVLLSTLNYECVLELSASGVGMKVDYGEDNATSGAIRIWKLHGSCNFLSAGIQANRGVSFTRGLTFEGGLRFVNPNEAIQYCLSNTGLYPAMALYMKAKPIQIGQFVIHGLQRRWGEHVRQAERVLVVGVRPYPEDMHIWGPLAECPGELGYIGPEDQFIKWNETHRNSRLSRWLGPRWDASFSQSVSFVSEAA